jgi:hypothetical protein
VTGRADRWIRRTTIGCVGMLALIAGTVSCLHMHLLVELHGQPGWVAALTTLELLQLCPRGRRISGLPGPLGQTPLNGYRVQVFLPDAAMRRCIGTACRGASHAGTI